MYPNSNVEARKLVLDNMITETCEAHPPSCIMGTVSTSQA